MRHKQTINMRARVKWVDFGSGLSDFSKDVRREGERNTSNLKIWKSTSSEEIFKSIKIEKFRWDEFSVSIVNKF